MEIFIQILWCLSTQEKLEACLLHPGALVLSLVASFRQFSSCEALLGSKEGTLGERGLVEATLYVETIPQLWLRNTAE